MQGEWGWNRAISQMPVLKYMLKVYAEQNAGA